MSINLVFQTSGGFQGGFVSESDGYLCFIEPEATSGERIQYRWTIQEGGGWTHRGGDTVNKLIEGTAMSSTQAEEQIIKWLEENQSEE
ncbi:MAG: hypothetical protein KZQ60_19090 [Candidatus Thiodiazotropha sp. (ex Lucinoma aequizonata)]|nr:hypothetical protein [Candidatus Thiodiazotropha sp. (ex Lucinoma aequizonata)]MCU7887153.1 hypothetical protein [Candidatus Thiodiazotropha sp. (ex Lucinoma aequizonata)]MCU7899134.1 hypothetical protein [Candidatus Thiodiazotropha sp. (ex Lucinoma aequizonata)]MCU7908788.1 hypothetical protein [Candidatus Thiodiazotropha sp. (ex Lucinoma aequizonata)]MCU7913680.1 hypothetical protein [Candidatus Thiodiazotropha sp. (ex Lucinoma aequizonata)]